MTSETNRPIDADSILWNWARWCWSGETVGNMTPYVSWEDKPKEINHDHARIVDAMHKALPHHEQMIIIAEYPRKNAWFGRFHTRQRQEVARRWITEVTGIHLTEDEYKMFLGFFKNQVERRILK